MPTIQKRFSSLRLKSLIAHSKHEILAAICRRAGQRRKIVVIAAYLPPTYTADRTEVFSRLLTTQSRPLRIQTHTYYWVGTLIGGIWPRSQKTTETSKPL